jgi:topoisomerase-4 subunit A
VDDFVAVKSRKAKGKRLTTYDVDTLTFIEPLETEVIEEEIVDEPDIVEEMTEDVVEEQSEQTTVLMTEDEEYKTEQLNLF